jgi:mono/diheme cytochrome c family protein
MGFNRNNSSLSPLTTTNRAALVFACLAVSPFSMAQAPPPDNAEAVERGAQIFRQYCTECHGRDGRAQLDVISNATDLTYPADYYSGHSDQDIYNSIANGAGVAMPAWRAAVGSDEAVWDLVYFVKSLWVEQP